MKRTIIENEEARLNALRNLRLLDTPPSESFDRITRLAGRLLAAPVSTISLTDRDRQWFKSRVGVDLVEIPRSEAPCNYAIHAHEVFVVPDLLKDARFEASLLARAGIRFYAGAPLITRSGYGLGTLCVVDDKPRTISEDEAHLLVDLAAMVMTQIEIQNTIGRIDPTTGLPNEHQLFEDLEDVAKRHPGEPRAGLLVELAPSQQIVDGLRVVGAAYVEELIGSATDTIRQAVGETFQVYHVGNARCVIVLDETTHGTLNDIIRDLKEGLRKPILCSGIPVTPDPAIGVYSFQADAVNPHNVLRRLFVAAADARTTGHASASYRVNDQANARSFVLLSDMRDALEHHRDFSLVYQPIVELTSGGCCGAEALLRWQHPRLGPIPPTEFVALIERTAFVRPLTDWVLDTGVGQLARWGNIGQMRKLSMNASAKDLEQKDFVYGSNGTQQVQCRHAQNPIGIYRACASERQ